MDFILAFVLFATTGLPSEQLVADTDEPAPPAAVATFVSEEPKAPGQRPYYGPGDGTCTTFPPRDPCGGALGFCPVWVCQSGHWVDRRPPRRGL